MIEVDTEAATPPFEQVRLQLLSQILSGELVAGVRLPTVRRLAGDLGLAVNTVARAYKELEEAGLVLTRGRAGTFVAANGDSVRQEAQAAALEFATRMKRLGINRSNAIALIEASLGNEITAH
ncbi:DNA-binding transcriptional regulator YhcF, GntR family [Agreia bicolorata]|uniref:DNA-binding transcriptional regulator YhcF, GntR family n=1 Tax=Agreia bicolorata TaxID=110935 RepID=A0A1T4YML2_9MICO|nr:GntR family transcriptional regulator [Agreia bicolorata]KJC64380.1 GntR family transcriptional regulator [Agreia bicolorata]SKB02501.1 DNA-binding transcriptional regulator YhcF, GntR family [Agreia bicolorata]